MKALINNQLVDVKVLKTRKLFWIFEQVLVEKKKRFNSPLIQEKDSVIWIPKSNLIEDYD